MTVTNAEIGAYLDSLTDVGTPASGDELLIYDVSVPETKKVLVSALGGGGGGSGGLVLLEEHTANNTSPNVDFGTRNVTGQSGATIQSDFDEYLFEIVDLLPASNSDGLYIRVHASGGYVSTSKYATAGWAFIYNAEAKFGNSVGALVGQITTSNVSNDLSNTAGHGSGGWVRLFDPGKSTAGKMITFHIGYRESGAQQMKVGHGTAAYEDTPAVDGMRFVTASGGNWASGTIRCYGIAK